MLTFPFPLHPKVARVLEHLEGHPLPLLQTEGGSLAPTKWIEALSPDDLFPQASFPQEAFAGLLLLGRSWERSHQIAQGLSSAEGSYWHAIAHRLEPDEFNSQYWFRKVGRHPIFQPLQQQAQAILQNTPIKGWNGEEPWSPRRFGHWCEEARGKPTETPAHVVTTIQQAEWNLLFSWCLQPSNAETGP